MQCRSQDDVKEELSQNSIMHKGMYSPELLVDGTVLQIQETKSLLNQSHNKCTTTKIDEPFGDYIAGHC
jgi:hypothetical protein